MSSQEDVFVENRLTATRRVIFDNVKLKCVCPHFAIGTKLADLRHTHKRLRKLLRSESENPEPQNFKKEIAGRRRRRLAVELH